MYINDNPIENIDDDLLGRDKFVQSLKKVILSQNNEKEAIVIGLDGKRGDGKTSVLRMLESELSGLENTEITYFEPRLYNKEIDIQEKFFDEFAGNLGLKSKTKLNKQKDALLDYSEKIIQSSNQKGSLSLQNIKSNRTSITIEILVIIGIGICSIYFDRLQRYGRYVIAIIIILRNKLLLGSIQLQKRLSLKNRVSTEEQYKRIKNILAEQKIKQIIIIDDIDRLNINQVDSILQIVKSSANFPNTTYILSFDKEIIASMLEQKYGHDNQYLEKIIQLQTSLPQLSDKRYAKVFDIYTAQFLLSVREQGWRTDFPNDDEQIEFASTYWKGMYKSFNNIRSIKRYFNLLYCDTYAIQHGRSIEEIYLNDLVLIEYFKIYIPQLYYRMKSNRDIFFTDYRQNNFKEEISKRLKDLGLEDHIELVMRLFPNHTNNHLSKEDERNNRLCVERNFDKYFALDVIGLSNSEFNSIRKDITEDNIIGIQTTLSEIIEGGYGTELYQRFDNYLYSDGSDVVNKDEIIKYNIFLINNLHKIEFQPTGIFDSLSSPDVNVQRTVYQGLKRLYGNIEDYCEAINQIIDGVKMYHPIFSYCYSYLAKPDDDERDIRHDTKMMLEQLGSKRKEEIIDKVYGIMEELFVSKTIFEQHNWKEMFYYMKHYHSESFDIYDWVKNVEGSDKKVFIDDFFAKSYSQGLPMFGGDGGKLKTKITFQLKELLNYYSIEEIDAFIEENYDKKSEYYLQARDTIDLYLQGKERDRFGDLIDLKKE